MRVGTIDLGFTVKVRNNVINKTVIIIANEEFVNDTFKWCEYVVPKFEILIKEIIEEYIQIHGKILTSQKNYSG